MMEGKMRRRNSINIIFFIFFKEKKTKKQQNNDALPLLLQCLPAQNMKTEHTNSWLRCFIT